MDTKPFRPDEARRIVQFLHKPAVFINMTDNWPGRDWTLENLVLCLEKAVRFRIGKQCEKKAPLFETECSYVEATLAEFLCWTRGSDAASVGPFADYPLSEYWAYADYKYIALLFQEKTSMFKDIVWSDFGYPGRDGRESTLWVGTNGANTPCHLDSYGCNFVFQIQGRKRWHLFPPDDTECMYPTRIPYEESSVFSQVNVIRPDLRRFPAFQRARAHLVTLEPGQVLFVPRHWWHFVESIDPVTVSVNSWIEMEVDDEARIGEALTKTIICALKSNPSVDNKDNWINPTEDGINTHDENMQYLNLAVKAYMNNRTLHSEDLIRSPEQPSPSALKRDSSGNLKTPVAEHVTSFSLPFGPHLIPVTCHGDLSQKASLTNPKEALISKGDTLFYTQRSTKTLCTDVHEKEETIGVSKEEDEDGNSGATRGRISTNDLLDCLLHPDVIALVTKLMIDRQKELD
ncbi:HSPB1-associated protein 1 homolog [Tachysurus vachellii]|uniref:HSPB1-associated protein 1 homolog n=1 Tax=Tachysurus vachellii TaxID=175792 RepID=UPI00296B019F|nr:HSPB1-associated protein 1 homolog [Tachysurus vachellii]XP_060732249.1 HSPB1-associated protein 1 homolog [Tachysurus vachellii]